VIWNAAYANHILIALYAHQDTISSLTPLAGLCAFPALKTVPHVSPILIVLNAIRDSIHQEITAITAPAVVQLAILAQSVVLALVDIISS